VDDQGFTLPALGFLRVAAITPELRVADVAYNTRTTIAALAEAALCGCALAVFPELGLTGYTCADLFYQSLLRAQAREALAQIAAATARHQIAAVVGLPFELAGKLYNCAVFVAGGAVLGLVPKTYLPSTHEYYERRWFSTSRDCPVDTAEVDGRAIPFGTDLLFTAAVQPQVIVGIEICEDLWAPSPPSGALAEAGATVILNPSASDEVLGKAAYRRELVRMQSARCLAGYAYAGASPGESTTDVVFGGHCLIAENGTLLAETPRFRFATQMALADLDLQLLTHERIANSSFAMALAGRAFRRIPFPLAEPQSVALKRLVPVAGHATSRKGSQSSGEPVLLRPQLSQMPFVPADPAQRAQHCEEIFAIQSTGLAKRLQFTGLGHVTIALSGGLDSTLALLVTMRAFDTLGLPHANIVAVTMPGFGTTARTRSNAVRLAELLGITLREIPIAAAVRQHFRDIGHDERDTDVTFENAQARERTQIVMDLANQIGGLEVGTGDLSELALGWATYNGDQMSMYHVNAGVPKTLVRYLIEWCAESLFSGETSKVLRDICATPISPELLPAAAETPAGAAKTARAGSNGQGVGGAASQSVPTMQESEAVVGPYLLQDFVLYYTVRYGFSPRKVFFLAALAFAERYSAAELLRWMRVFYRRFFANQFKRSAMPDGPKVGSVALSPRGDWRMPSDAAVALWQRELDELDALLTAQPDGTSKLDTKADAALSGAAEPGG
jgi:NAD+ synthase (glutamine-hydrolysing)